MSVGPPRKLSDFGELTEAEEKLLAEYPSGEFVIIGDKRPDADAGPDVQIRADLIRYLLLGGREDLEHTIHERGVQIHGARITGILDLQGCRSRFDLVLLVCHFDQTPNLLSATLALVAFDRSELPGMIADRLTTSEGLFLRHTKVTSVINLRWANIGGNLDCDGATLTGDAKAAEQEASALIASGITVKGYVFLRQTKTEGGIRLVGAEIGGDLDCVGADITSFEYSGAGQDRALILDRAKIKGAFFLLGNSRINGTLDMTAADIGALSDDPACWPIEGKLLLDRCRYGAFTGLGVTAGERLRWLSLQDPTLYGAEFQPQPWEQCAKVLREMGHRSDARLILIDKERRQRAWNRSKLRAQINTTAQAERRRFGAQASRLLKFEAQRNWDAILSAVVGYGYAPQRALYWLIGTWLFGVFIFATAYAQGAFKPNNPFILRSAEWAYCAPGYTPLRQHEALPQHAPRNHGTQTQLTCFLDQPEAAAYPRFNPWTYSADTLLPIVSLEMQQYWIPDETAARSIGQGARIFLWAQIAFGWALSLLAVAGFSGLVRND